MAASYVTLPLNNVAYDSLYTAQQNSIKPGECLLMRDMGSIAPVCVYSTDDQSGKWTLSKYSIGDDSEGRLLIINSRQDENPSRIVPPEFEVRIDLLGCYAVWIGVPRLDLRPRAMAGLDGVDVALDNDPAFVHINAARGTRHGSIMGPMDAEIMCFWKCAELNDRSIKIRVPYGTFISHPWGAVRGGISSICLVRLRDEQVVEYRNDINNKKNKRVIVVNDGFSHYFTVGEPGCGLDAHFAQTYRDTDVDKLLFQTPSTGIASWPSNITGLPGELISEEDWANFRKGDRRMVDYLHWAIDNNEEGFRVITDICKASGMECHASLRMNLFWPEDVPFHKLANGKWWNEHPEVRKPGSAQIDYAHPEARRFVKELLAEIATNYPVHGINLDFTRWPPIADPVNHGLDVLTSLIGEVRERLDQVTQETSRYVALSALVVEGYHADWSLPDDNPGDYHLRGTLEYQKIDLEAWLARGNLDFICVQAFDQEKYMAMARRYGVKYYALQDQDPFDIPGGFRHAPVWQQSDRPDEDPLPGEEFEVEPHLNSTLDPTEYDRGFLERYQLGVDGICIVNAGMRELGRLGHIDEMAERVQTGEIFGQHVTDGKLQLLN